ncbi:MAG: hypothetical protein KC635_29395, partial [Myxococcales bacterium]|nr:hypothetical protein [Myxococcales bacterium]
MNALTRTLSIAALSTLATLSLVGPASGAPGADPPARVVVAPATLPLAGLELALPTPRDGTTYQLSSSWALTRDGLWDGRDVVDEIRGGDLVAGTWVSVGWFTAGDCAAVVHAAPIEASWERASMPLWGARWAARGGVFTFDGPLGARPAVALCLPRGDRKQLLLMRFFLDQPTSMGEEAMRSALVTAEVPRRAFRAFVGDAIAAATAPLFAPTVRNRGEQAAMRTLRLPATGLKPLLPNDGFVWTRGGSSAEVDQIDRMAPALPEVTVEVARIDGADTCSGVFDRLTAPRVAGKATRVPPGWVAGPMIHPVDNVPELTL